MAKKSILLSLGVLLAVGASASPLTPEQALQRVRKNGPVRVAARAKSDLKPVYTAKSVNGVSAAYVFNNAGGGFMILSADDVAYPVLGYSDKGSFDKNNIPPQMQFWLDEYGRRIEWAEENGFTSALQAPAAPADRHVISPLLTTAWSQEEPYNLQCPMDGNYRSVSGCVATSMAQVMNYHEYPEIGTGSISYRDNTANRSMDFSKEAFDWANMADVYENKQWTEAQANAVAYLMKACGYSVQMSYSSSASGATGRTIASSLVKYFKYDAATSDLERNRFSGSAWEQKMYENLRDIGPVVINGQAPMQGGHSFVCDGYDGNGYFHINWGWGGVSDGYFALDALNPDAQGTGGATGGFNFQQNAIFGIQPPRQGEIPVQVDRILQYGSTTATIEGRTVTFDAEGYSYNGWGNATNHRAVCKIGAIIYPDNMTEVYQEVEGKLGNLNRLTFPSNATIYRNTQNKPVVELPEIEDGSYILTLASRPDDGSAGWEPVETLWGYRNYCLLKVENGVYSVTNVPMARLSESNLKNNTELYAGKYCQLSLTVANNSDMEITQGYCPGLYDADGKRIYSGESVLITLMPGENVDRVWNARFYNSNGSMASVSADTEFTLKLFDPSTGNVYEGNELKVTMQRNPGTTVMALKTAEIMNVEKLPSITQYGREYTDIPEVKDFRNIKAHIAFQVNRGYFDGLFSVSVARPNPENEYGSIPVMDAFYTATPFLSKGEAFDEEITFDFPTAQTNNVYILRCKYTNNGSEVVLTTLPFYYTGTSGIESIVTPDQNCEPEYYNLQGLRIKKPRKGEMVIVRQGKKVSKVIW